MDLRSKFAYSPLQLYNYFLPYMLLWSIFCLKCERTTDIRQHISLSTRTRTDPGESNTADSVRQHVSENGRVRVSGGKVGVKPRMLPVRYLCQQAFAQRQRRALRAHIERTNKWIFYLSTQIKKVFPYSLPSVGPGADPAVQAVSPQVTWCESRHRPGSRLSLLSARPAVTPIAFTRWRYL